MAAVAGFLAALPVALLVANLGFGGHASHVSGDLSWGMIFLGVGLIGVAGLIQAPIGAPALIAIRRQGV
jgi:hypothetical protein